MELGADRPSAQGCAIAGGANAICLTVLANNMFATDRRGRLSQRGSLDSQTL